MFNNKLPDYIKFLFNAMFSLGVMLLSLLMFDVPFYFCGSFCLVGFVGAALNCFALRVNSWVLDKRIGGDREKAIKLNSSVWVFVLVSAAGLTLQLIQIFALFWSVEKFYM